MLDGYAGAAFRPSQPTSYTPTRRAQPDVGTVRSAVAIARCDKTRWCAALDIDSLECGERKSQSRLRRGKEKALRRIQRSARGGARLQGEYGHSKATVGPTPTQLRASSEFAPARIVVSAAKPLCIEMPSTGPAPTSLPEYGAEWCRITSRSHVPTGAGSRSFVPSGKRRRLTRATGRRRAWLVWSGHPCVP
jgi:hypothetical protein